LLFEIIKNIGLEKTSTLFHTHPVNVLQIDLNNFDKVDNEDILVTYLEAYVRKRNPDTGYPKIIATFGGEEMTSGIGFRFFQKMSDDQKYHL